MIRLPEVVALTLCHHMDVNPQLQQLSLVGFFHSLRFPGFPTAPQRFTVHTVLFGGSGEGTMELAISQMETEATIDVYRRWFAFPERWMNIDLEIPINRCVFPEPGRYHLQLRFDDRYLSHRYLDIGPVWR
jgi:hypothetical protein